MHSERRHIRERRARSLSDSDIIHHDRSKRQVLPAFLLLWNSLETVSEGAVDHYIDLVSILEQCSDLKLVGTDR